MSEMYGYRCDRQESDPRKAVTVPEDCINYGWEPFDPRWGETDLIQQLMHEHDGIDEVHCCYRETPGYLEFKISLEPFEHSMSCKFCSKYPHRSILDHTILTQIGIMVTGTLNWEQQLLSLKWKIVKANIVEGDDTDGN